MAVGRRNARIDGERMLMNPPLASGTIEQLEMNSAATWP